MKYSLFVFAIIFILLPERGNGTHLVGGTMHYSRTEGTLYEFEMRIVRDCFGGVPGTELDDTARIGLFNPSNHLHKTYGAALFSVDSVLFSPDTFCLGFINICLEEGRYLFTIDIGTDLKGWSIVYQRCCRSDILINVDDPINTGLTLQTIIQTSEYNRGAEITDTLFKVGLVNSPLFYDASTFDSDGDSLVYRLLTPFVGASDNFPQPSPPPPPPYTLLDWNQPYSESNMLGGQEPLRINQVTGQMTAIPELIGLFQIAYGIYEYRNGELIAMRSVEFLMLIIPGADVEHPIHGTVYTRDSQALDHGKATLLEHHFSDDSLHLFDEQPLINGMYDFGNIHGKAFYLKAEPTQTSIYYDRFVPTYWPRSPFWYNAIATSQCDITDPLSEVHLTRIATSTLGQHTVTGSMDHIRSSAPPKDVTVFLMKGDSIAGYSRVDQNGDFEIGAVAADIYHVYIDAPNTYVFNDIPPQIHLFGDTHIACKLHNTYLEISEVVAVKDIGALRESFNAYITSNGITLALLSHVGLSEDVGIHIHDLRGNLVDRFTFPRHASIIHRHTEAFAPGMYIVSFTSHSGNGNEIIKVIKLF